MHKYWTLTESALALKGPVMEAEFAIDERTPLSLYDGLLPQLIENRRFAIKKDEQFSIRDFTAQQQVLTMQWKVSQSRVPGLENENYKLKGQLRASQHELSSIKFWIDLMEDGVDTKQLVKEYSIIKQQYKELAD